MEKNDKKSLDTNINLIAGADFGEIALVIVRWRNNYFSGSI